MFVSWKKPLDFETFLINRKINYNISLINAKELEFFSDLFHKTHNFSLINDEIYNFRLINTDNPLKDYTIYQEYELTISKYLINMDEELRFSQKFDLLLLFEG